MLNVRCKSLDGSAFPVLADFFDCVITEHAVALGLRLVKPLFAGALMRKRGIRLAVGSDVRRFVSKEHRLYGDKRSIDVPRVHSRVLDRGNRGPFSPFAQPAYRFLGKYDRNSQVNADFADGISKILVGEVR